MRTQPWRHDDQNHEADPAPVATVAISVVFVISRCCSASVAVLAQFFRSCERPARRPRCASRPVKGGNAVIEKLLAKGVLVNLSGHDRCAGLCVAAAEGNLPAAQFTIWPRTLSIPVDWDLILSICSVRRRGTILSGAVRVSRRTNYHGRFGDDPFPHSFR